MLTPEPQPAARKPGSVDLDDMALARALIPWVYGRHTGPDRDVAAAAHTWLVAKSLVFPDR